MKTPGRIIFTATVLATTLVASCNSDKDKALKNQEKEQIVREEPVCIYGPPEMLNSYYEREESIVTDESVDTKIKKQENTKKEEK